MKVAGDTFPIVFILDFARASGETVPGTQRYILNGFLIKIHSHLRRGDFKYTTILPKGFSYLILVCASGEAILGTQRYFPKAFLIKIASRLWRGDFGFWLRGGGVA